MSNETTENFLTVMATFEWPEPQPIKFRLYHDQDGRPLCYSMEDLPYNFIEIDSLVYAHADMNVRVIDGRLIILKPRQNFYKIKPGPVGVPCHPQDVCVIVKEQGPNTKWN